MTLIVCGAGGLKPGENGTPPIMVEEDRWCEDCHYRHEFEMCPICWSWIDMIFGIMPAGYGEHKYCQNVKCSWSWHKILGPDEE